MLQVALLLAFATPPSQAPSFTELARKAAAAREASQLPQAIELYRRAVRVRPSWTEGWWYLGTIFYDQDRFGEARDAFRKMVALDAKNARAFALLGLCEYHTGELRESLEHLDKARSLGVDKEPELAKVVKYHSALLLNKAGQFEEAFQMLAGLAQQGEESPGIIEAAGLAGLRKPLLPSEITTADRPLVLKLGRALYSAAQRRPQEAQEFFNEVLREYPNEPNVHFAYGSWLMFGEPDKGVQELKRELEISPDHVPAMIGLTFEYLKRGDPATALPYARRAVELKPDSFVTHNALGRVLVETGDVPGAIRELQKAVEIAPDSPQNRLALATAYAKMGRREDAARERAEFLRLRKIIDAANATQP